MSYLRTLLLALLGASLYSCYDYDESDRVLAENPNYINVNIYVPKTNVATRADVGNTPGTNDENKLHRTCIWIYENEGGDTGTPIGVFDKDLSTVTPDADGKITIPVDLPVTTVSNKKNVDIFVIANVDAIPSATVGGVLFSSITNIRSITRANLLATVFGKIGTNDDFGVTTLTQANDIATNGLPMSDYALNQNIYQGVDINPAGVSFELKRAISKIRFFFSRATGVTGVSVTGITINGVAVTNGNDVDNSMIPETEYVFPSHTALQGSTTDRTPNLPADVVYVKPAQAISVTNNTTLPQAAIFENDKPEQLVFRYKDPEGTVNPVDYSQENGGQYVNRLETALGALTGANLTTAQTYGLTYLRESGKKICGTISFRLPGDTQDRTTTFEMAEENDFTRNHYYIVYGYFIGGSLYVRPIIADWINAPQLDYTIKMGTSMRLFDSWLYRYDTVDQDYSNWTNWEGSHMVVSGGKVETPVAPEVVAGRPTRSPQIQLITTGVADASVAGSGTFELTIDNDDFEIIRANKNDVGVVTSYEASTNGVLVIPAGDDVHTYFYVVPKEGVTPSNPVAKVSLYYNDPVLGKEKVTFNYSALPGYSDDSSEIWVYYVAPEDYNITGKLKMYYQDSNNPLVPTPVQS